MDKIKHLWRNLSLKKSIILCIFVFAVLAILLTAFTAALCFQAEEKIKESYPTAGEKYYLTSESGERLGEGTYIAKQVGNLSERDERLLAVLGILPALSALVYSAVCILAASVLFYRSKLKEPLEKLRAASEKIAENDLDFQLNYDSEDEVGQLCASFELMRSTLENNFSQVWRQVEERKQLNAAFAHDLRTPLTILKGYDEMLQSVSDPETRDIAETMGKHTLRLERYVDSMSHLRRLEDTKPQGTYGDLDSFVRSLTDSAEILCRKNGKQLSVEKHTADLPVCVDGSFVSQVNDNLISNAVRYAEANIKVTYECSRRGFSLCVTDDGKGFSREILRKAADPYVTEAQSSSEHFGLGLYICKILCDHHRGSLKIENSPDGAKVTAFFGSLP